MNITCIQKYEEEEEEEEEETSSDLPRRFSANFGNLRKVIGDSLAYVLHFSGNQTAIRFVLAVMY